MSSARSGLSCLLLGEEPLLARCGDVLRERGHRVAGVVTSSAVIRRWCDEHGIPSLTRAEYPARLAEAPVDVLLSITFPALIADDSLRRARVAALNYHDGPLPRYAGINASAWALVHGERRHGVVWHHVTSGLDAGDVLERREIEIDARETSVSLNMKNAVLALDGFRALCDRLERGELAGIPQDPRAERSIFSRHDRPAALCAADFAGTAEAVDRLARACEFGPYPNRFGLVKVVHGGRALLVREAQPIDARGAPGALLRIEQEHWDVACGSGAVRLRRFSTVTGTPLSGADAAAWLGVRAGDALADPHREQRAALSRGVAEAEPHYVTAIARRAPPSLPFATAPAGAGSRARVELSPAFQRRFGDDAGDAITAAFAVVVGALCREAAFDLALADAAARARLGACAALFFPAVPLHVAPRPELEFSAFVAEIQSARCRLAERGPFLHDLVLRHPALADPALARGELSTVAVRRGRSDASPAAALTLALDGAEVSVASDGRVPESRVKAIAAELGCVLSAVTENPSALLESLDLLDAAQLFKQVFAWNATLRRFPETLRIHDLFEQRVASQPDATALVFEGRTESFAELERAANRVANTLLARGVKPGDYVGIHADRGFELVHAMIGAAKAGAAYVPIDVAYPAPRARFMLDDAGCKLVLTNAARAADLGEFPALILDGAEIAASAAERPDCPASARDVCYAIYTSGSTGQPKGVVLAHRAVVNTLDWVNRSFEVTPADRLLFVTSPSFDLSVYDVFGALGAGASVEIASDALLRDPLLLAQKLVEPGITIWDSAPPALARLGGFLPERAPRSSLRLVMLSGDWIPVWLPGKLREVFPAVKVESLGGATEAAIWSNHYPVRSVDPSWTSIPYGHPIQNARYYVLDQRMRPAPAGIPGDLYIGGVCLAEGYLSRPELTRERFLPDPFLPGERIYRTGDLARYWADGTLEFLGRADSQVKIRGYRVELGELEHALSELPDVRQAVCTAYTDASGAKSLAAYVVLAPGATLDEQRVREQLARSLPDYMLPSQILGLPGLPLTPNGKLDRQALPSPTAHAIPTPYVAPRTELERRIAAIWEELLDRRPIGATDDFFALGGHSLLAVMLVTELKTRLGIDVPLSRVLESPTIGGFAASISGQSVLERRSRHLLALHSQGTRPPLVLCAGVGGHTFTYRNFPKLLGADQPVLTLMAVGAEGTEELVDHSIEQMAEIYEPELFEASPDGPLVLGGFSFGALPAFELARRLIERGRDVPLLVSFDGFAPGYPSPLPFTQRVAAHVKEFIQRDGPGRYAYLRDRALNVQHRAFELLGREQELAPLIPFADPGVGDRMRKLWVQHVRARSRYRPQFRLPCNLLLIKAGVPYSWIATKMDDPYYGWQSYVSGDISVVTVPGEHTRLFAPESQPLIAEAVARHIARWADG